MLKNRKWNISSKIALGYVLIFLCMAASIFFLINRIDDLQKEIHFIADHDIEVHNLANQIEKNVLDMETGQRGYVITGDSSYLEPYNDGKRNWQQGYSQLYERISDNPAQQKNLEAIKSNIEAWMAASGDRLIPLRKDNNMEEILRYYKDDKGKRYMDQMRSQWEHFRSVEKQLTDERVADLESKNRELQYELYILMALALLLSIIGTWMISRSVVRTIRQVVTAIRQIASSDKNLGDRIEVRTRDEIRELAEATNLLLDNVQKQDWLKSSIAEIAEMSQGINHIEELARSFMTKLAVVTNASHGSFYIRRGQDGQQQFVRMASYAGGGSSAGKSVIPMGEGLVGQAALENRILLLQDIPESYIQISSGLGGAAPRSLLVTPVAYEGRVEAVFELASFEPFSELHQDLLEQVRASFGTVVNSVLGRMEIARLLSESQAFAEELQTQSEELQAQSEELLSQQEEMKASNESLKRSEERLQLQQDELEKVNAELSKRTSQLEAQVRFSEEVNMEIERQKEALQKRTEELTTMSKYKSEFLANMSHELRTPLNSMLILSQFLAENKEGNLSDKQVEFAHTIHASGSDLLRLIDEILDLSKVEAGKLELNVDLTVVEDIAGMLHRNFQPLAMKKGLRFRVETDPQVPPYFYTDGHRLMQILKNFLSNAFKFTPQGEVSLRIYPTEFAFTEAPGIIGQKAVAFAVTDSGIGIPKDKQELIFEAFQQVDGTTSRKFGGTGLGLTISRELAQLLGGDIRVESESGQGSTFTLYIPAKMELEGAPSLNESMREAAAAAEAAASEPAKPEVPHISDIVIPQVALSDPGLLLPGEVEDDREAIEVGDKVMLIIEDDVPFAKCILDMARSRGFKGLVATQGDKGLALANKYKPHMIMLDIHLPVMDGWTVLDLLKHNPETRHIPVHVLSVVDEPQQSLVSGAMAYMKKPVSKDMLEQAFDHMEEQLNRVPKRLLIVEDNVPLRDGLVELIAHDDVAITAVGYGEEALRELHAGHFDCMVLDLELADMSGFELLDRIRHIDRLRTLPIIIFTGKDLDMKQERELRKYAESIIVKNVKSQERLYAETALYLHRVESQLPEERRKLLHKLNNAEDVFAGKHIMLVEDDIRNVFALSNVLEEHKLKITYAENGREALNLLEQNPDIDLVLMDIMMPEMDGYEAMKRIRSNPRHEQLPVIALTAKAMKEDRQKCIEAGASDYISKPINTDKLLSMLKVWLYK